jgi:hypothetical protein
LAKVIKKKFPRERFPGRCHLNWFAKPFYSPILSRGCRFPIMRLWTIHPAYLDAKGLVAAWREALLAQKVLSGSTRGYTRHPQLARFRSSTDPNAAIAAFLAGLAAEAKKRGYRFDTSKIARPGFAGRIEETNGQLLYEWKHLRAKLRFRAPEIYRRFRGIDAPEAHPLFRIIPGGVRDWERRQNKSIILSGSKRTGSPRKAGRPHRGNK